MATGTAKPHTEEKIVLDDVVSRARYVGLLQGLNTFGTIGDSPPYYEPTADWYMRMPVFWSSVSVQAPTSSQVVNTAELQWIIPGNAIVFGIGLFDAITGGNLVRYANLAGGPITAFGFLKILAGTLVIIED